MNPKERFLKACRNNEVDRPPVWMMRQAGRYLPQYRAIKQKHPTKEMMQTPEIACEITLQPVDLIGVDAAILYSDILMIPDALGMGLNFLPGEGPKFEFAIQDAKSFEMLNPKNLNQKLSYVFEAAKLCYEKLPKDFPLLGFAGAPFTVACYMIAGGSEKGFPSVRELIAKDENTFLNLMSLLSDCTIDYLIEQANAGACALQLFDTWAGLLTAEEYKKWAYPYTQKILDRLKQENLLSIHFIKGGSQHLDLMMTLPSNVIGVDWSVTLKEVYDKANQQYALQGNFHPDWLLEKPDFISQKLRDMLQNIPQHKKGYILNLGHGIGKETPVEHARFFVEKAKELGALNEQA